MKIEPIKKYQHPTLPLEYAWFPVAALEDFERCFGEPERNIIYHCPHHEVEVLKWAMELYPIFEVVVSEDFCFSCDSIINNKNPKKERAKLTKSMRYDVLSRDEFKCKACGAKAGDQTLVVDHIKPISRGGKTIIINLQSLCEPCNQGKGSKWGQ